MVKSEHVFDLLAGYVLGILSDAELVQVTEHLPACEQCRAELEAIEQTVHAILLSAPPATPPAASRARLMARIQQHRETRQPSVPWWQRLFAPVPVRLGFALAGFALGLSLALIFTALNLQPQPQPVTATLPITAEQPAVNPYFVHLQATDLMPNAWGVLLISMDGQEAVLVVEGLEPLEGLDYQFWLRQDGQPINAGFFSVMDADRMAVPVSAPNSFLDYRDFALTIEPAGGSILPTGEQVLGGSLDIAELLDLLQQR
ncbi:MAG: hypothetical protein Kow0077_25570 [Anaerolineae bacterium]